MLTRYGWSVIARIVLAIALFLLVGYMNGQDIDRGVCDDRPGFQTVDSFASLDAGMDGR